MPRKPQVCSLCKIPGHNKKSCKNPVCTEIETDKDTINENVVLDVDYILNNQVEITKSDYDDQRDVLYATYKKKLNKLKKIRQRNVNEEYFYINIQEVVADLLTKLIDNPDLTSVMVIAQPGVGKTMTMDCIAYELKTHRDPNICRYGDRFSVFTTMSSRECRDQLNDNLFFFTDDEYVFNARHNPDIKVRMKELSMNPLLLKDHIFLVDECHIACEINNTLGKELKKLGLTKETIKSLNIKFILISATPDKILKEFLESINDNWAILFLKPGEMYKGFREFHDRIINYKNLNDVKNLKKILETIETGYNEPKHHFIRVKSAKFEEQLKDKIKLKNWKVIEYNQEKKPEKEEEQLEQKIKTQPQEHTFWFIKDFYRASKRLRLNKHIGYVIEPFTKEDVTVTAQGLIPRWFGYYTIEDLIDCNFKFICNLEAVDKYIQFIENKSYDGIDYSSRNMNNNNFSSHQSLYIKQKDISIVHEKGSNPIIKFDITEDEVNNFNNTSFMFGVLKKYKKDEYEKYKDYTPHCWNIEKQAKKWRLDTMLKENAYSSSTNITDKKENVIMFYLYKNEIIINAWSGKLT
jgi:hypothetical protein